MKELKEEIIEFLEEINQIMQAQREIPSNNYIKFDPYLFMTWRLINAYNRR